MEFKYTEEQIEEQIELFKAGKPFTIPLANLNKFNNFQKRIRLMCRSDEMAEYKLKPEQKEKRKKYFKEYNKRPEVIAKRRARNKTPEAIAYRKEYYARPEVIARQKAYRQLPEIKARYEAYNKSPEVRARERKRYAERKKAL